MEGEKQNSTTCVLLEGLLTLCLEAFFGVVDMGEDLPFRVDQILWTECDGRLRKRVKLSIWKQKAPGWAGAWGFPGGITGVVSYSVWLLSPIEYPFDG